MNLAEKLLNFVKRYKWDLEDGNCINEAGHEFILLSISITITVTVTVLQYSPVSYAHLPANRERHFILRTDALHGP